jgi:hypothetical protein
VLEAQDPDQHVQVETRPIWDLNQIYGTHKDIYGTHLDQHIHDEAASNTAVMPIKMANRVDFLHENRARQHKCSNGQLSIRREIVAFE